MARVLPGGPDSIARMGPMMGALAGLLDALEDRSGLTYDPSPLAQDLADTYMQATIANISASRRLETIAVAAVQERGMTLAQRLDAAGNL